MTLVLTVTGAFVLMVSHLTSSGFMMNDHDYDYDELIMKTMITGRASAKYL